MVVPLKRFYNDTHILSFTDLSLDQPYKGSPHCPTSIAILGPEHATEQQACKHTERQHSAYLFHDNYPVN
jgi:hypothetical protein